MRLVRPIPALLGASLGFACSGEKHPATTAAPVTPTVEAPAVASIESPKPKTAHAVPAPTAQVKAPDPWSRVPVTSDGPRAYAKTRNVWVRGEPSSANQWIGFLWFGSSVKLRDPEPRPGPGCASWYAVEPRGYVCVDGKRATLDPDDPELRGVHPYSPDLEKPWPHEYGESLDAQSYATLPTHALQRAREWDLEQHLARVQSGRGGEVHETLLGVDLTPAPPGPRLFEAIPRGLQMERQRLKRRSTVAWSREVEHEGRSWLLTDDLRWVPKDRVVPYPKVTFQGVKLGASAQLPLAFFRDGDRPRYRRGPGEQLTPTDEPFARLSHVALTGKELKQGDATYLETREPGVYVARDDVVVPEARETTPWGAPLGGEDTTGRAPRGRKTWIDVSVHGGWLVAYEDRTPVFTTLIAPGRGGTPHPGKEPIETASTPTGNFKITGKFATSTMVAPGEFVHSAVPWAQNFSGPHALHGAYWHDDWGKLKSGGCVNLSPLDAKHLFAWTEPEIPTGWHGVRWLPKREAATTFIVHR